MKQKKKKNLIILAIICLIIVLIIAVLLNVIKLEQLPSSFIGALLGAAITGVITLILLEGQTESQELKERNVTVFKERTKVFQKYINNIWAIWEDHKVTPEEFKELTSGYYRDLLVYLDNENIYDGKDNKLSIKEPTKIIASCLSVIGECLDKKDNRTYGILRDNFTLIINVLCDQIGLGGRIDKEIIKKHDEKMWPVMFRDELLEAFNNITPVLCGILEKGKWEQWSDENHSVFHDAITYKFIKFPACTFRYDLVWDNNGIKECFFPKIMIPVGYKEFDNVRNNTRNRKLPYLKHAGSVDILKHTSEDDKFEIPAFCFTKTDGLNEIRIFFEKNDLSREDIARTLASRANETFYNISIENLLLSEFIEKYEKLNI